MKAFISKSSGQEVPVIDDNEIVELYWQRSEAAVAETERKYSKYCYAIAHNILRNHEDSQECVNDALARAWDAIPPARPAVLRTFLGKITRNLALNALEKIGATRRGSGQVILALSELEECVASDNAPHEQLFETEELTLVINEFLASLDVVRRRIFVRRYWYADSIESIAVRNRMTASGINSILFRLRKKLKNELEKKGIPV